MAQCRSKTKKTNLLDRKLKTQRNTPSAANSEVVVIIEEAKQRSSKEVTTVRNEEMEVQMSEEVPIQDAGGPMEAAGGVDPVPAVDVNYEEDVTDSDYESGYDTNTDEKFVNNYLKEHDLI